MQEISQSNSNSNLLIQKNPMSKLHQYFGSSSYLSQQDQLSIFINDFPKIDLSEFKSINQLLPTIIKQNKLLADKCQQQVALLKQSFMKHQSLIKSNRQIKKQLQRIIEQFRTKKSQLQSQQIFFKREQEAINAKLKLHNSMINAQNQMFYHIIHGNLKKCQEFVNLRQTRLTFQDFKIQNKKQNLSETQSQSRSEFVELQSIEKYCKQQRKKGKYYSRVKSSVEEFCNRLNKIIIVVDQELIAKQFEHQTKNFLAVIDDLIQSSKSSKKRKNQRSLSTSNNNNPHIHTYTSSSSIIQLHEPSYNFFEDLLKRIKLNKQEQKNQQTQQISIEIQELKSQLEQSRQYYQNYLVNVKLQYEKQSRLKQEELTVKTQINKHYEQVIQKLNKQMTDYSTKHDYLSQQNQCWMKDKQKFVDQIDYLSKKIQKFQNEKSQLEQSYLKKMNEQQQDKKLKINQITQFKQDEIRHRKMKQQQILEQIQKNKKKIKFLEDQKDLIEKQKNITKRDLTQKQNILEGLKSKLGQFQQLSKNLEQKINSIQNNLSHSKKQNQSLVRQIKQLQHETNLQTNYIKQLQTKLSTKEQKLKSLTTKLSTQSINKKQVYGMKTAYEQIQKQNIELGLIYKKQKQENGRLKTIIKQMKKQLQDVFMTVHNLKQLQKDRERLILQAQQSQRWKNEIMKDYDEMKYQILRVETENKNLLLQNKHYKNSLKRIQSLK